MTTRKIKIQEKFLDEFSIICQYGLITTRIEKLTTSDVLMPGIFEGLPFFEIVRKWTRKENIYSIVLTLIDLLFDLESLFLILNYEKELGYFLIWVG